MIVNVEEEKVIEVVKVDGYIECSEIWNDYIVVLTTDEESESKLITCWKFNEK